MLKEDMILKKKTISVMLRRELLFPLNMQNKNKIIQLEAELNKINKDLLGLVKDETNKF